MFTLCNIYILYYIKLYCILFVLGDNGIMDPGRFVSDYLAYTEPICRCMQMTRHYIVI